MTSDDPSRATLTVNELARILGVSSRTAAQLIRTDVIPAIRAGRRVLISRAVVDRILAAGHLPLADDRSGPDAPHDTATPVGSAER